MAPCGVGVSSPPGASPAFGDLTQQTAGVRVGGIEAKGFVQVQFGVVEPFLLEGEHGDTAVGPGMNGIKAEAFLERGARFEWLLAQLANDAVQPCSVIIAGVNSAGDGKMAGGGFELAEMIEGAAE